jgi:hypothetical protein
VCDMAHFLISYLLICYLLSLILSLISYLISLSPISYLLISYLSYLLSPCATISYLHMLAVLSLILVLAFDKKSVYKKLGRVSQTLVLTDISPGM